MDFFSTVVHKAVYLVKSTEWFPVPKAQNLKKYRTNISNSLQIRYHAKVKWGNCSPHANYKRTPFQKDIFFCPISRASTIWAGFRICTASFSFSILLLSNPYKTG